MGLFIAVAVATGLVFGGIHLYFSQMNADQYFGLRSVPTSILLALFSGTSMGYVFTTMRGLRHTWSCSELLLSRGLPDVMISYAPRAYIRKRYMEADHKILVLFDPEDRKYIAI